MQNRPDGVELLDIARRTLLDSLLPALPKDKHYDALMIANAMAMASRELGARQAQSVPGDAAIDAFLAAVPGRVKSMKRRAWLTSSSLRRRCVHDAFRPPNNRVYTNCCYRLRVTNCNSRTRNI